MRRSPRVLLAAVGAVAAVALGGSAVVVTQYPRVRDARDGTDLEPGLLQVGSSAVGEVSLGDGVSVLLASGGMTISRRAAVVWRSVDRGALVTAGLGKLQWRGGDAGGDGVLRAREQVDEVLADVRITGRSLVGTTVTYTGRVFDREPDAPSARDLTITITRRASDSRVLMDVEVPRADVVAVHEFRRPGFLYRGFGEQFSPSGVNDDRFPIVTRAQGIGRGEQPLTLTQDLASPTARGGDLTTTPAPMPFYLSSALSGVGLDSTAYSVIDVSHGGRVDLSVWSPSMRLRLYDADSPTALLQQHTADVGRMPAAPAWSTSGAVVGVRGGSAKVLGAVTALQRDRAVVAAVLVRDGGDRQVYPDWDALVQRLAGLGVRTMTSVSPSVTGDLLTYARSRGWLVTSGEEDTGLVDLTNSAAVDWYTGVLAARMRADGVSGWVAPGGSDLPMDARLAHGDAADEHNAWPLRWAQLTDDACRRAGVDDCLVLHESASERSPPVTRGLTQAEQVTDWSVQDGLASVLPAKIGAGMSGLTQVSSGVGGWTSPSVPVVGGPRRSDELLARWGELEAFGSLLRSEDGDRPAAMPQVYDSPARRAAFARATRLFAATAPYRRQVMAAAAATGVPVVRAFWLEDTNARQARADQEYFFGSSFLVVPVVTAGQRSVRAVLPAGEWTSLFTGRTYAGPPEADPTPTPTRGQPAPGERGDVPVRPGADPDASAPPAPIAVDIPAPMGQPVVLYRADDAVGKQLRETLRQQGLLTTEEQAR